MIQFKVPGNPLGVNACYRIITIRGPRGHSSLRMSDDGNRFEQAVALAAEHALRGAARVKDKVDAEFRFYFDSERPDWDGPIKPVSDALQGVKLKMGKGKHARKIRVGGCIENDRQIRDVMVRRRIDRKDPRLEVWLWRATTPDALPPPGPPERLDIGISKDGTYMGVVTPVAR